MRTVSESLYYLSGLLGACFILLACLGGAQGNSGRILIAIGVGVFLSLVSSLITAFLPGK